MQDFFPNIKEIKLENALYIIATPIGNLGDITLRALEILSRVDIIICEDTRVSQRLLEAYKIKDKKLIVYNDHSDDKMRHKILDFLVKGQSVALISDAGTPLISDPGYKLVNFLRNCAQKVIPIPGVSSITAAISASGIACDNFLFLGFAPTSKTQKTKLLKSLPKDFTFIFFESANRIIETLNLIEENLGNRKVCIARELTKMHEEIILDDVKNIIEFFAKNLDKIRGEFVLVVEKMNKGEKTFTQKELISDIYKAFKLGYSIKDLSQNLSEIYSIHKKEIYKLAIEITKK